MSAGLWGTMACTDAAGDTHWWSLSPEELDREVDVAVRRLTELDFPPEGLLLVVAGVGEAGWFAPYQRAARRLGGISCTAEPSEFDAGRVAAFLTQFEVHAVLGLDARVVAGLPDAQGVLPRAEHLLVRHEVLPTMQAMGLPAQAVAAIGPVLAVECPQRNGLHIGADAWQVEASAAGLVVHPAVGRDLALPGIRSGVRGTVQRGPCGCGSADPRVVLSGWGLSAPDRARRWPTGSAR